MLITEASVWCLPLVLDAFFRDPADFPGLRKFDLQADWSDELHAEDLAIVMGDPRLKEVYLDRSVGSSSLIKHQLECLANRIEKSPRSLLECGLLGLDPKVEDDDPLLDTIEGLVLDILRSGRNGVEQLTLCDEQLFRTKTRLTELNSVVKQNQCRQEVAIYTKDEYGAQLPGDRSHKAVRQHLLKNMTRQDVVQDVAFSLVSFARVLLLATPGTPPDPFTTILSLPAELLHLI